MAINQGQAFHDHLFPRRDGWQRRMSAFAREGSPTCLTRGDQARHAQARARTQQPDHAARHRLAAAHLAHALAVEPWQRHGQRREVVDHQQGVQLQLLAHLLDGELPVVVGHAHPVAIDRVGDRHRRALSQAVALHQRPVAQVGIAAGAADHAGAAAADLLRLAALGRYLDLQSCRRAHWGLGGPAHAAASAAAGVRSAATTRSITLRDCTPPVSMLSCAGICGK